MSKNNHRGAAAQGPYVAVGGDFTGSSVEDAALAVALAVAHHHAEALARAERAALVPVDAPACGVAQTVLSYTRATASAPPQEAPPKRDSATVEAHRVRSEWRAFSSVSRSRTCGNRIGMPSIVSTVTASGVVSGYRQVETCGKRSCPVCGPRIAAIRAAEVQVVLDRHTAPDVGGGVALWLRTIPTLGPGDLFVSQGRRFCRVWRRYTGHRRYKALVKRYGVLHTIWGRDDTYSDAYEAAHYHRHGVYLLSRPLTDDELAEMDREFFALWRDCCRAEGAGAPNPDGNGFEQVRDLGALSRYVTRAVREVARADVKDGQAGLSPQQVRARFLATGDVADLDIVHDWEASLLDRSCGPALCFSRGLRAAFGLDERTDEQALAEEVEGFTDETAHVFTAEEWRVATAVPGRTGVLLVLARNYGMQAVRDRLARWLSARGAPRGAPFGSVVGVA